MYNVILDFIRYIIGIISNINLLKHYKYKVPEAYTGHNIAIHCHSILKDYGILDKVSVCAVECILMI